MERITGEVDRLDQSGKLHFEADIISFAAGAAGAAVSAAERLEARAIVALAGSNVTALLLSKWRPRIPILALSSGQATLRRLNVLRGVFPVHIRENSNMEEQIRLADDVLLEQSWGRAGDTVVVVGAIPLGQGKETNSIRFHRIRPRENW